MRQPLLVLVLGPAEQFAAHAQGFISQFEIARMKNGALQGRRPRAFGCQVSFVHYVAYSTMKFVRVVWTQEVIALSDS